MNERRFWIGLTGGIGSGKSTVSKRLGELGAKVLDADVVSKKLLDRDGACYDDVLTAFGSGISNSDGSIDRKTLAQIVFSDETLRKRLNGIVHPAVDRELFQQAQKAYSEDRDRMVVFDVPLLFESGMYRRMWKNVLVEAEEDTVIRRVCLRDGCTEEAVRSRIQAQMPVAEKQMLADFSIVNNGGLEELMQQVTALYQHLKNLYA